MAPSGFAAYNADIVPAESQWMINLDLNTLRSSALGEMLIEMIPEFELTPENDPVRPNFQKILETIGTVTAYGSDLSGEPESIDGALVVQGTTDLRKIVEGLVAQMTVTHPEQITELTGLPFEAYKMEGGVIVAFPEEPIVVVSKSQDQLTKALAVYRRKAPSMATEKSPLMALLPKGEAFYVAAASVVPSVENLTSGDGPDARILRMAKAASVALGESGDLTTARVQLDADSNATAEKLVKIVDGVIAMASLAETSDQRLSQFVNSASVTQEKNAVKVELSYPTARIVEMIENIRNEAQSQPAWNQHQHQPEPFNPPGTVLATWVADQQLADDGIGAGNFVTKTVGNVQLETGTTLALSGRRDSGENVRFDYLEITPADGSGKPVRYEAEFMRLSGYQIERVSHASGGELIRIQGDQGDARMRFMGAPGVYSLAVRYLDETDGASTFAVSIVDSGETASPE
jgi:hypothetical protein